MHKVERHFFNDTRDGFGSQCLLEFASRLPMHSGLRLAQEVLLASYPGPR